MSVKTTIGKKQRSIVLFLIISVMILLTFGFTTDTKDPDNRRNAVNFRKNLPHLTADSESRLGARLSTANPERERSPVSEAIHEARRQGNTARLRSLERKLGPPVEAFGESTVSPVKHRSRSRGYPGELSAGSPVSPLEWGSDIHVRGVDTDFRESYPAMATASDGTIYIVWENAGQAGTNEYLQFYYSTDGGDNWSAYGFIENAQHNLMQPSLAIGEGSQNWLVAAYVVDSTVSYIEVATIPLIGGGGFSPNIVVPGFYNHWENYEKPNVWTDSYDWNGWYIYLTAEGIFDSAVNNYNLIFWRSMDFGASFASPQVPLGNTDSYAWRDPDGTYGTLGNDIFIAAFNATNDSLTMIKSTDFGTSWADTVRINLVNPLPTHPVDPDIEAAANDDNIMLCCVKSFNGSDNIAQTYSTDAGTNWSSLFSLEGYTSTNEFSPELTANEGGNSWHVTYTAADWWIYYNKRPQDLSGFWQTVPELINDVDWASASYSKKAIASNWNSDEAGIAWADYRQGSPDYDIYFDRYSAANGLYSGPAAGSIAGGAQQNTGNFPPPAEKPAERRSRKFIEIWDHSINPRPNPPTMTPPLAPQGANEVDDSGIQSPTEALSRITDFFGIADDVNSAGYSFIPPDPICAAGPDHVMACVNTDFAIFDKSGNKLVEIDATEWFENVLPGLDPAQAEPFGSAFDPQVAYDAFENRWIMLYVATDGTAESYLLISVSDDDNPVGTWSNYAIPGHMNGSILNTNLCDYPKLGLDSHNFYVTSNMFDLASGYFQYVQIRVLEKSQFYNNPSGPVSWTDFWNLRDPDNLTETVFTVVPAMTYGSPSSEYLINDSPYTTSTFMTLWQVLNPATPDSLTAVNVPVTAQEWPPDADQLGGGTPLIDVGGRRVRNAVYRDGKLVTAHSVADNTGAFARARFLEIDVTGPTVSYDISFGATDAWYYYPAVTLDNAGNTVAVFTRSSLTEYAGVYFTGISGGTIQPGTLLKEGEANYVKTFGGSRNRWGDYNGIAVDPVNEANVWMFAEYAASPDNTWGTWWGEVTFGAVISPPQNLMALEGYDNAVPLFWDAPAGSSPLKKSVSAAANFNRNHPSQSDSPAPPAAMAGGNLAIEGGTESVLVAYNIYRSTVSGGPYSLLATVDRQYYRDVAVTNGTPYFYVVEAVFDDGTSGYSSEAGAMPLSDGNVIHAGYAAAAPAIDGVISSGEWVGAAEIDITGSGLANPVTLYASNDGSYLYLAVDDPNDTGLQEFDQMGVYFDEDRNYEWPLSLPSGEGNFWAEYVSGGTLTDFRQIAGWWPTHLSFSTAAATGVTEGISTGSGHIQYEMRIDLSNSELNAAPGDRIGLFLFSYDVATLMYDGNWPAPVDASGVTNSVWAAPFSYGTLVLSQGQPEIIASIPDDLEGVAGGTLDVPVNLTLNGNQVGAVGAALKATNGLLSYSGYTAGPIVPGNVFNVTSPAPDSVRIGFFDSGDGPITQDGLLVTLHFDVSSGASPGQVSQLNLGELSASDPLGSAYLITGDNGQFTVVDLISVAGNILYVNGSGGGDPAKPVADLDVELYQNGGLMQSQVTDAAGDYLLPDIAPGPNYRVEAHRVSGGTGSAVNPTDALIAFNAFLGSLTISGAQHLAADADCDLQINPTDALLIFNRFLGSVTQFPCGADWRIYDAAYDIDLTGDAWKTAPGGIDYPGLAANLTNQNFYAVAVGDVSLDWAPARSAPAADKMPGYEFRLTALPLDAGRQTLTLEVELTGNGLQRGVYAFGGDLLYDPSLLEIAAVNWGEILPGDGFHKDHHLLPAGDEPLRRLRFGGFSMSADGIRNAGPLLTIQAVLLSKPEAGEEFTFTLTNLSAASQLPVSGTSGSRFGKTADGSGFGDFSLEEVSQTVEVLSLPETFSLSGNYPNPFNPRTRFTYQLPEAAKIRLTVYNGLGQVVRTLVDKPVQAAGTYTIEWDGTSDLRQPVSSGIYFYRMEAKGAAGAFVRTGKMLLLK